MYDYKLYSKTEKYKAYQKAYREKHKKTYKERRLLSYHKRLEYYKNRYQEKKEYYQQYRLQHKKYYREYYQKYKILHPDYYSHESQQLRKHIREATLNNLTIRYTKKPKKPLDDNFVIPDKISIKI